MFSHARLSARCHHNRAVPYADWQNAVVSARAKMGMQGTTHMDFFGLELQLVVLLLHGIAHFRNQRVFVRINMLRGEYREDLISQILKWQRLRHLATAGKPKYPGTVIPYSSWCELLRGSHLLAECYP